MATPPEPSPFSSADLHRTIIDNLADGVYYVDPERTITYWNRGAERLSGYPAEAVVGHRCYENILRHVDARGNQLCFSGCPLQATLNDAQHREMEVWLRHADGSRRPVRVRTAPILDANATVVGAVEVFDDASLIVAARRDAEVARRDALTDGLTGLANRRMFEVVLSARLEDLARYGTPVALLIADLDHFKAINDSCGHLAGDQLLRVVAETLRGAVREGDLVARWGGEEFAVILGHAGAENARQAAERLRALVASSALPDSGVSATISVGGACAEVNEGPDQLVARADAALYKAKQAGRNTWVLAPPSPT